MAGKSLKREHLLQLLIVVLAVLALGLFSGVKFFRIDLTSEKRYSLSESGRELMKGLDDVVYVKVYLDGELPASFVNFKKSIRELLDDFGAYAGNKLQYEFINIYDLPDEASRSRIIASLYDRGLKVTSIQLKEKDGGSSTRIIFPGAMLSYKSMEIPVNLLKNNPTLSHEHNLNNSIQTLEYEFVRAIHSLIKEDVPRIAFIEGHGELDSLLTHSLMDELKNFFQVDRGFIKGRVDALLNYDALVIARPTRPFNEADKFAIDQYIMSGGKVLFFLDPVYPFADSLANGTTVALANPVGLENLLFKYGFRINYDLVADLQCNYVPVNTAPAGEQASFNMMPWVYFPLLSGPPDHPVSRGLNYVMSQFASSLDTVEVSNNMKRSVLLYTSPASRKRDVPVYISMEEVMVQPDPALYKRSNLPVGVLAEGSFTSYYKNYPVPEGVSPANWEVVPKSKASSIFVLTDGDIAANEVDFEGGTYHAQPLGYDQYTRQTFGNKEFLMNVISYMNDERGIMELRSREFKLRLLDGEVLNDKSLLTKWKVLNILLPLLIVALAGLFIHLNRKRRFAR